eukprot:CAMPEP_0179995666 /NCGR_PEP_ID=MMETSP0984-20121128/7203_1 /TAXON_ID=483367 /ORGANISM="non described non described, Strain CCMP 2436" /LENGTH=148 /DNA_ID=CAMNT_0021915165 /DNA_START=168 /DNA_END=610 /DNA_ORIENTATION=-
MTRDDQSGPGNASSSAEHAAGAAAAGVTSAAAITSARRRGGEEQQLQPRRDGHGRGLLPAAKHALRRCWPEPSLTCISARPELAPRLRRDLVCALVVQLHARSLTSTWGLLALPLAVAAHPIAASPPPPPMPLLSTCSLRSSPALVFA